MSKVFKYRIFAIISGVMLLVLAGWRVSLGRTGFTFAMFSSSGAVSDNVLTAGVWGSSTGDGDHGDNDDQDDNDQGDDDQGEDQNNGGNGNGGNNCTENQAVLEESGDQNGQHQGNDCDNQDEQGQGNNNGNENNNGNADNKGNSDKGDGGNGNNKQDLVEQPKVEPGNDGQVQDNKETKNSLDEKQNTEDGSAATPEPTGPKDTEPTTSS